MDTLLGLSDGTTANCVSSSGDDANCIALINAIHSSQDGWGGQEPNQGTDPNDWRTTATRTPDYLSTVYPNGLDWNNAFDPIFTP